MRKLLATGVVLFAMLGSLPAQDTSLQFLYITKDYNTRVNPLIEEIKDVFNFVQYDASSSAIFYLADIETPIVVKVNLPGDNRKDIDLIYSALTTQSETAIDPALDLEVIPRLFEQHPLISETGEHLFTDLELRYYVCPSFWELYYNEQVIAALWFVMEFDQPWARDYVSMSIFHQTGDGLQPDLAQPFGPMDLCKNYQFQLLTY